MNKEMKESISHYVELYDAIQEKTGNDVITVTILQEIGKDTRSGKMAAAGGNNHVPATEKQKDFLRDLGVEFLESITKKEASDMIEQCKKG